LHIFLQKLLFVDNFPTEMKITHVQIYPLAIPLIEPIKMAGETISFAQTVILQLSDDSGRAGWGEASIAPLMTGETLDSLVASIKYLASNLEGFIWDRPEEYTSCFNKILYANNSAKSCVEMALLDLYCQKNQLPIWKYLQDNSDCVELVKPKPLQVLRMLGGSLEKEIFDAKALRSEGFSHWKIKVGILPIEEDLNRVEILCDLLSGDTISADANGVMSLDDAIRFCTAPSTKKLAFVEQLICSLDPINFFSKLKQKSPIPIGLDESIHGVKEIEHFIEAKALDGVSLKLIKTGGIIEAFKCANFLRKNNLRLNLACKVAETSVSAAATSAIGFAMGGVDWGFSMSNQYLEFDICKFPLKVISGQLDCDQLGTIGLGVEPDRYLLKKALSRNHSVIEC
jgi:L-alanine-DL-glutamate epimerase-like enolase superfamily enzyme